MTSYDNYASYQPRSRPPTRQNYAGPGTPAPPRQTPLSGSSGLDAKVVVMGNTGVGKTSLVHRYTEAKFSPTTTTSTTGAFFLTKKLVVNNLKVRLQIWDTAGQERFRSMAPMYYRGANAAIIVYDITNDSTFQDVKTWLEELKKNSPDDLPIYIVGAKADLSPSRAVSSESARFLLHNWFPPPRPLLNTITEPKPSEITNSTFSSYIRPRFPSLTSSRQVQPPSTTSSKLSTSSVQTSETSISRRPSRRGAAPPNGYAGFGRVRDIQENETFPSPVDNTLSETRQELPPNFYLFEVSAKDDQGIQDLFYHLVGSIIARRDLIEQEHENRVRDSVLLTDAVFNSGKQNDDRVLMSAKGGWASCCTG